MFVSIYVLCKIGLDVTTLKPLTIVILNQLFIYLKMKQYYLKKGYLYDVIPAWGPMDFGSDFYP